MIYSGINDNIERLVFLKETYSALHVLNPNAHLVEMGYPKRSHDLNIDIAAFRHSKNERILLELLLSWSIITLESMANHAIAELYINDMRAVEIIEKPRKNAEIYGKEKSSLSELQCKIILIGNNSEKSNLIAESLCEIIQLRNSIIHDKPYRYE